MTTWMELEDIMLNEIRQTEKGKYCINSLICRIEKKKPHRKRDQIVLIRGRGWEVGEMGEGGQKVQNCSYKINKSRGCYVQHDDYS